MHEWALAEAIIATAIKVAEREGLSQIARIKIKMGELQQIDTEIFEFALREISQPQSPIVSEAEIEMEAERAVLKCRVCGQEWPFAEAMEGLSEEQSESIHFLPEVAHVYVRCPRCQSPDFEIVSGRGVQIDSIEGE